MRCLLACVLFLTFAAQSRAADLLLYTSQPPHDAELLIAAFEKANPDIHVRFVRDGTTQLMSRLQAEFTAGAPRPDVLLIADATSMQALKQQNRLSADQDADVRGLPAETYDPDRTYFGTKLITTGIMVHHGAPPVTSWQDLLSPGAHNQVVLPSPLYSGAAMIFAGTMGEAYMRGLAKNGAVPVAGNGQVLTEVAGGQRRYGIGVDFMALNAKKQGSPVDFVFPKDGVTAVTEPVAIMRTARDVAAAKAFVAFLISEAGQRFEASQGYLSIRADVPPPPGFPPRDQIKLMPTDIPALVKDQPKVRAAFIDAFGG